MPSMALIHHLLNDFIVKLMALIHLYQKKLAAASCDYLESHARKTFN
jgi:hypothetical protein